MTARLAPARAAARPWLRKSSGRCTDPTTPKCCGRRIHSATAAAPTKGSRRKAMIEIREGVRAWLPGEWDLRTRNQALAKAAVGFNAPSYRTVGETLVVWDNRPRAAQQADDIEAAMAATTAKYAAVIASYRRSEE